MINLLPFENKISVKKEYLKRIFVIANIFIMFILFSAILLIYPSFSYSNELEANYNRELAFYKNGDNIKNTESIVLNLNKKLSILKKQKKDFREISVIVEKIINNKDSGIKLNSFSYVKKIDEKTKDTGIINGHSDSRASLISFVDLLKKDASFSNVNSPLANLLKTNDTEFSITIELKN